MRHLKQICFQFVRQFSAASVARSWPVKRCFRIISYSQTSHGGFFPKRCVHQQLPQNCFSMANSESADSLVETLCAEVWAWRLKESPELATFCGIHDTDDQLDDISEEAYARREDAVQEFLKRAEEIDVKKCMKRKRSLLMLKDQLQEYLNGSPFKMYYFPINFMEGVHIDFISLIHFMKFETYEDYERYVGRLEKLPKRIWQVQDTLTRGLEAEMVMHRHSVEEVPMQLAELIAASLEDHPYIKPFYFKDKQVDSTDLDQLKTRAMDAVASRIIPAFQDLKAFLEDVYFYKLRSDESVSSLPNGKAMYQQCLNFHLSFDYTPEEVHELGLKEVDRIYQLISDLAIKEGYDHMFDFVQYVKGKEEEQFDNAKDVLNFVNDLCYNKIQPKLPPLFDNMPDSDLRVVPTPPLLASCPAGFYYSGTPDGSRPGSYFINIHDLEALRKYELTALSLHEGEPGHHLQSEYALKEEDLPDFRRYCEDSKYYLAPHRFTFYTAYIEGWGLYSEALGEEMGVYEDSESLLGRYTYEIFRAVRLVVDTGIHAFGWSRNKAIEYVKDHTLMMDYQSICNEVHRFITWPGQACAYKVGELKIWELRNKAEKELGDRFKLSGFHEAILRCGPVPLRFLNSIVNEYIQETKEAESSVDGPVDKAN